MKRILLYLRFALPMLLLLTALSVTAATPVNIAMLAFRPADEVKSSWQPLIDYLNKEIPGYDFYFHAFGYEQLETAIAQRTIDFVLTNPSHYMLMTYRNGLSSPLSTLVPIAKGQYLSNFGGVIITKTDQQDINSINDLHDQTIATVTKGSLGGYQAQAVELTKMGINMSWDVKLIETGMPHDSVVTAVLEGRAKVGFVRTGILEGMASEGKLELNKIKVIAPKKNSSFPLLLSTQLYPEWPFSAMPDVNKDLSRKVAAVLLSLPHGGKLAKKIGIRGFTIPTDYEAIRTTLETLRLPPFDSAPLFTSRDIWNKYHREVMISLVLITIIAMLTIWLFFLNRRLAEGRQHLQRAAQKWHRLLTAVGEGVYGVDAQGLCTFVNPAALDMLGYSEEELLDQDLHTLFHHHREDGSIYPADECPITLTLNDGDARNWIDWFWRKNGSGFPVMLTTAPMKDKKDTDDHDGIVVVFRDISKQMQIENKLRKEATTDPLTGIANRRSFIKHLNMELERFKRFEKTSALIMVDLDRFKKINDSYGHAIGDEVLQHFTKLSSQYLRATDLLGRIGGEEFCIILSDTDIHEALVFAERYRLLIANTPTRSQQGEISYTVSMGITEFGLNNDSSDRILERADSALYQAKEAGRNTIKVCLPEKTLQKEKDTEFSFLQLAWKPQYECHDQIIDQGHKTLFRLANVLLSHITQQKLSQKKITDAFDNLLFHVAQHFAEEEEILEANNYELIDEHREIHKQLISQAQTLRLKIEEKGSDIGEIVNFLVSEIVAGHMLQEDIKFFKMFKN